MLKYLRQIYQMKHLYSRYDIDRQPAKLPPSLHGLRLAKRLILVLEAEYKNTRAACVVLRL